MNWIKAYNSVLMSNPQAAYNNWAETGVGEAESFVLGLNTQKFLEHYKGNLLEVGCGNGGFAATLLKDGLVSSATVIDVSDICIEYAKKAFEKCQVTATAVRCAIEEYRTEEKFDIIAAWEVLEHLRRVDLALSTLRRMLKEDGALVGSVPEGLESNNWLHLHHFYAKDLLEVLSEQFDDIRIIRYEGSLLFAARQPKER